MSNAAAGRVFFGAWGSGRCGGGRSVHSCVPVLRTIMSICSSFDRREVIGNDYYCVENLAIALAATAACTPQHNTLQKSLETAHPVTWIPGNAGAEYRDLASFDVAG